MKTKMVLILLFCCIVVSAKNVIIPDSLMKKYNKALLITIAQNDTIGLVAIHPKIEYSKTGLRRRLIIENVYAKVDPSTSTVVEQKEILQGDGIWNVTWGAASLWITVLLIVVLLSRRSKMPDIKKSLLIGAVIALVNILFVGLLVVSELCLSSDIAKIIMYNSMEIFMIIESLCVIVILFRAFRGKEDCRVYFIGLLIGLLSLYAMFLYMT